MSLRKIFLILAFPWIYSYAVDNESPLHEFCITPLNEPGLCIKLSDCKFLYKMLEDRLERHYTFLKRSQCGYSNGTVFICCPSEKLPAFHNPFLTDLIVLHNGNQTSNPLKGNPSRSSKTGNLPDHSGREIGQQTTLNSLTNPFFRIIPDHSGRKVDQQTTPNSSTNPFFGNLPDHSGGEIDQQTTPKSLPNTVFQNLPDHSGRKANRQTTPKPSKNPFFGNLQDHSGKEIDQQTTPKSSTNPFFGNLPDHSGGEIDQQTTPKSLPNTVFQNLPDHSGRKANRQTTPKPSKNPFFGNLQDHSKGEIDQQTTPNSSTNPFFGNLPDHSEGEIDQQTTPKSLTNPFFGNLPDHSGREIDQQTTRKPSRSPFFQNLPDHSGRKADRQTTSKPSKNPFFGNLQDHSEGEIDQQTTPKSLTNPFFQNLPDHSGREIDQQTTRKPSRSPFFQNLPDHSGRKADQQTTPKPSTNPFFRIIPDHSGRQIDQQTTPKSLLNSFIQNLPDHSGRKADQQTTPKPSRSPFFENLQRCSRKEVDQQLSPESSKCPLLDNFQSPSRRVIDHQTTSGPIRKLLIENIIPPPPRVTKKPEGIYIEKTSKKKHYLKPPSCGQVLENRIMNGYVTNLAEHPWSALIEYKKNNLTIHRCGGSLVSNNYVVTAAHCILDIHFPGWKVTAVRLGEWDKSSDPDCILQINGKMVCADPVLDVGISQLIPHPEYNRITKHNDIGLIRMNQSVRFTIFISPICLVTEEDLNGIHLEGIQTLVTGWGKTETELLSDKKRATVVNIWTQDHCQHVFEDAGFHLYLKSNQICAIGKTSDACKGDSGGPLSARLIVNQKVASYLMGIVSAGYGDCSTFNIPGIYTRVSSFFDWITYYIES